MRAIREFPEGRRAFEHARSWGQGSQALAVSVDAQQHPVLRYLVAQPLKRGFVGPSAGGSSRDSWSSKAGVSQKRAYGNARHRRLCGPRGRPTGQEAGLSPYPQQPPNRERENPAMLSDVPDSVGPVRPLEVASGDGGSHHRGSPDRGLVFAIGVELEHEPDLG